MDRPAPMDRLLCGDVGYGKTELAMRAAFKAVDAGYQVAVLVPTTVLAEQHRRTFSRAMADILSASRPLAVLPRRRSNAEIIQRLADGKVDIVIGTHRLVQHGRAVQEPGPGDHRRGAAFRRRSKERLKDLRHERRRADDDRHADSAHAAPVAVGAARHQQSGNAAAGPTGRSKPAFRFDEELIRHAILRELNRDGQIYFVHNRVYNIATPSPATARIVPEARIAGRLMARCPNTSWKKRWWSFVDRDADILVATTIVESGLDIPNANTIFIDEADNYGLADLHQLRGRVGRYKHRAYAMLLDDPPNASTAARQGLRRSRNSANWGPASRSPCAIWKFAGRATFSAPSRAGTSPRSATNSIATCWKPPSTGSKPGRRKPPLRLMWICRARPTSLALRADMRLKIDLYRRLARVTSSAELADFSAELLNRFGAAPPLVGRLLQLQRYALPRTGGQSIPSVGRGTTRYGV